jgi:DNA-directed RNA polymerase specialized sigma24 family protein
MEGLSYEDIARALRVSRGTVESRLFRARERLRERLRDAMKGWD